MILIQVPIVLVLFATPKSAMRQKLCRIVALLVLVLSTCGGRSADAEDKTPVQKPNIVFILADDAGLGDVHCTGGPYNTPNTDALAAGGTRFEYCYATPLCGPSRCEFLTGRYPFRTASSIITANRPLPTEKKS